MATYTNFGKKHKSINEWILAYENNLFNLDTIENIHSADWIMWESSEDLKKYMEGMYKAIKMVRDTNKFDSNEVFVTLKEVPVFGSENYNYANVIFSRDPNMLPVIMVTPDKKGRSELFLISNKHAKSGTLEELKEEIINSF